MMECPRCGFQQPEDRFCANCGLNTALFFSKPKPFLQKLSSHPAFYVVLALVLVISMYWYVQKSPWAPSELALEKSSPTTKSEAHKNSLNHHPSKDHRKKNLSVSSPPSTVTSVPTSEETQAKTEEVKEEALPSSPSSESSAPTATTATPTPTESQPPPQPPHQFEISFIEVTRESWTQAEVDGKISPTTGRIKTLIFPQKDKLNLLLNNARLLSGARSWSPATGGLILHFSPSGSSGSTENTPGLHLHLVPSKTEGSTLEIEISGYFTLKKDPNLDPSARFETTGSLTSANTLVLTNILPRRPLPENDREKVLNSPLLVLNSQDFLEGGSEFLVLIQGK